ncbi:hypothetical protein PS9374_03422 [Planomonospora sphaerica]|uniref:Uncharacterized protein n=1 Tax=Planomonospora sphaerica TaxID=161355 RepID=A0A171D7L8_9ACTN|nr:hypothetical protein [Planomonospora sphaerica]GAT67764.1 hypothetical protein PS9374_03422 [Planomonospora sphaerica]
MGYPPQYGPPPRGETGRGLTVIVLMVAGLIIGTVIAVLTVLDPSAAQDSPPASASTSDAPGDARTEEAVRQAAQAAFDAYADGRSGDFWDLWSTRARSSITREEYVRLFQLCPQLVAGAAFTVADVYVTGDTALVSASRTGDPTPYDYDFVREDGSWRHVPPPEEQEEYRVKGVDRIVAERRTAGTCGTPAPITSSAPSAPASSAPSAPATSAPSDPATSAPSFTPPTG